MAVRVSGKRKNRCIICNDYKNKVLTLIWEENWNIELDFLRIKKHKRLETERESQRISFLCALNLPAFRLFCIQGGQRRHTSHTKLFLKRKYLLVLHCISKKAALLRASELVVSLLRSQIRLREEWEGWHGLGDT